MDGRVSHRILALCLASSQRIFEVAQKSSQRPSTIVFAFFQNWLQNCPKFFITFSDIY